MSNSQVEQEQIIQRWARWINRVGLATVAIPLIEIGRAWGFLGAQTLIIAQPILGLVLDGRTIGNYAALLENPNAMNLFIERVEQEAASSD